MSNKHECCRGWIVRSGYDGEFIRWTFAYEKAKSIEKAASCFDMGRSALETWESLTAKGFDCVQVELRVVQTEGGER